MRAPMVAGHGNGCPGRSPTYGGRGPARIVGAYNHLLSRIVTPVGAGVRVRGVFDLL
jgi:hypothetical protein